MELLNFNTANCKHCYKCLRVCPVKAIKFKNDQASIVEERCIACGHCFIACPQNARKVKSDLNDIKEAIKEKRRIVATVAPSFVGSFSTDFAEKIVTVLKKLGIDYVEETAVGADIVANLYKKKLKEKNYKNIITTCCPSANFLIEKYFPSLTKYMFPIVSPMIAHGKLIKRVYGMDTFVIFIGPCISKKVEAKEAQHDDVIDAVMTFEELKEWVYESQLDIDNMEYTPFDRSSTERGRNFPLKGGVLGSFLDDHIRSKYDVMNIDGIDECIDMLNTLMKDDTEGLCVELNACREGCINGPGVPKDSLGKYERKRIVKRYVNYENENFTTDEIDIPEDIDFGKVFVDKSFYRPKADEATIQSILRSIDKFTPEDELNCGACGYSTCREKVQAVYEGMAEKSMCMPYMKSRAERLSNHIFESSPNAIFVVDEDLKVVEFNKVCEKIFNIKSGEIMGKPISVILDDEIFRKVIETQDNIILQKVYYKEYGMLFLQNIILIEKENALLVIMTDITDEEKSKEELVKIKENALQAAQDVIEKQMRVAQEIAGLLGETTAETKVVLTKLKELVLKDGDVK